MMMMPLHPFRSVKCDIHQLVTSSAWLLQTAEVVRKFSVTIDHESFKEYNKLRCRDGIERLNRLIPTPQQGTIADGKGRPFGPHDLMR